MLHYSCLTRDCIISQFYWDAELNVLNRMKTSFPSVFSPILTHEWFLSNHKNSVCRNKVIVYTVVAYCICHTRNVNMFRPKHSDFQTGKSFAPQMYHLNAHIYLYNNLFTTFLLHVSVCYTPSSGRALKVVN